MDSMITILIERGNYLLNKRFDPILFTKEERIDEKLNDINNYPHLFVLACIMDRQIKAERAWKIPCIICEKIDNYSFKELFKLTLSDIEGFFRENSLHRFNEIMAKCFYDGIKKIHDDYQDNASLIWERNLPSATIVKRFLQFEGIGIKIATMATNILARDFKIPMKDKINIDISPDVQVKRVFSRLGLVSKNSSNDELIFCARELNPGYPGIFDLSVWEIGRNWCRPNNPFCDDCYLRMECPKIIT